MYSGPEREKLLLESVVGTVSTGEVAEKDAARAVYSRRVCWLSCCSATWLIVGMAAFFGIGFLMTNEINDGVLVTSPSSSNYAQFTDLTTSSDNKLLFSVFNITNPADVLRGGSPVLAEIGPFVYDEVQLRFIDEIDLDADTLTYRQHTAYYFNEEATFERSGYRTDDVKVCQLNLLFPAIKAQIGLKRYKLVVETLLGWDTDEKRMFNDRTAREILMGYDEDISIGPASVCHR